MDTTLLLAVTAIVAISAIQYEKHLSNRHDWEPYPETTDEIDYSGDDEQTACLCCQS